MYFDVFVSYAREDGPRVVLLVEELRRLRYRVFFDVESIRIGENWKQRLERSIKASRVLLLCWSAHATSDLIRFEYLKAEGLGNKVVPWLLDNTPLPAMFDLQAITAVDPTDVAAVLSKSVGWNLARRRFLGAGLAGIAVAAGSGAWLVRIETRGFELQGVVVDDQGLPLAGAQVIAESAAALTDSQGRYSLKCKGLQPEYIRLRFKKAGHKEELMNVSTEGLFRMVMVKMQPK